MSNNYFDRPSDLRDLIAKSDSDDPMSNQNDSGQEDSDIEMMAPASGIPSRSRPPPSPPPKMSQQELLAILGHSGLVRQLPVSTASTKKDADDVSLWYSGKKLVGHSYQIKSDKLTFQKMSQGRTCIYSLITKVMYNPKPTIQDYNDAIIQPTQGLKLICSPMGCMRDMIPPEHFTKKIVAFHQETGAPVSIVCCDQVSQRELRRGLSHQEFMLKLKESIENGICNQLLVGRI
ncbi:hypothetical protein J6590_010464 [Homalodisca vitripennis]|nr:hypothetical protein J6590_010464 [Homalodisca vitripennis]